MLQPVVEDDSEDVTSCIDLITKRVLCRMMSTWIEPVLACQNRCERYVRGCIYDLHSGDVFLLQMPWPRVIDYEISFEGKWYEGLWTVQERTCTTKKKPPVLDANMEDQH